MSLLPKGEKKYADKRPLAAIANAASKAAQALRATIQINEPTWCPYTLYPKQELFLSLPHTEAFYGGAGGGGKSVALLAGALKYVNNPKFAGLIIRRNFPDLEKPGALIDMARDWLANTGADYKSQTKTWTFPSGAKLVFGHCENVQDMYKYQGGAYHYISFDELTQLPEQVYTYIAFSRKRKVRGIDIPTIVRSAANPGGEYGQWVHERFIPDGFVSAKLADRDLYEKEGLNTAGKKVVRAFVPAYVKDNIELDVEDYIESLDELDAVTREQMLNGDWQIQKKGDVYPQWDERRHVISWSEFAGVIGERRIPENWICGVSLDWGSTSPHPYAVLFHSVPPENHPLNGTVFVYRHLTGYDATPRQVAERIKTSMKPWNEHDRTVCWVGSHEQKAVRDTFIIEHDLPIGARKGNAESGVDTVRDYLQVRGEKNDPFRPTLKGMPSVYFVVADEELSVPKTDAGFARLRMEMPLQHYTESGRIFNKQMNDMCVAEGTLVETLRGPIPIEQVSSSDLVLTREGYKRTSGAFLTAEAASAKIVEFSDGSFLVATGSHPLWIEEENDFVPIDRLRYCGTILAWERNSAAKPLNSTDTTFIDTRMQNSGHIGHIFSLICMTAKRAFNLCIKRFGSPQTDQFQKDAIFTTKTAIRLTTPLTISNACLLQNTIVTTLGTLFLQKRDAPISSELDLLQKSGTQAKLVKSGTAKMEKDVGKKENPESLSVAGVPRNSSRKHFIQDFVIRIVNRIGVESLVRRLKRIVFHVAWSLRLPICPQGNIVLKSVTRIAPLQVSQRVWNLAILDGPPEFFANGALVHNCDSLRYGAAAFWPAVAPVSERERLLERLGSVRVHARPGLLSGEEVALLEMQKRVEQDALLRKIGSEGSNSHPLDWFINEQLGK